MSSRPSLTAARQGSLYLSETAFHDAAVAATTLTQDHLNDDPNALKDTEQMIKIAQNFLERACPQYLQALEDTKGDPKSKQDRLVKVGRNVSSTMRFARRSSSRLELLALAVDQNDNNNSSSMMEKPVSAAPNNKFQYSKAKIDASMALLVKECSLMAEILSGENKKVPKVRFGKTELQMPILTLGCMRFQQSWNHGPAEKNVLSLDKVTDECQENLVRILKHAISTGVTHIETAKGYGSSELQLGAAFKEVFDSGICKREDLIIQTKGGVSSSMTIAQYKQLIIEQVQRLQLDYVDLFSVHGLNMDDDLKHLFEDCGPNEKGENKGNLYQALVELKEEGIIRHIGFSSHGRADLIKRAIETDAFEYCNIHYHFCGSYTCSGDGVYGGNLENVRLATQKHDMGLFIISPYDKGGRLYAPSNKLRDLCLPDMEPMTYGSAWLWQHEEHDPEGAPIHTIVCGAGRPSDLDQPLVAAAWMQQDPQDVSERRRRIAERIQTALEDIGNKDDDDNNNNKEWCQTWHVGLPNWHGAEQGTQLGNIVWLYNCIKGLGMLDFARDRYGSMEGNFASWDSTVTKQENVEKNMTPMFNWCPGCAFDKSWNYTHDLKDCPKENQAQLLEAIQFVHEWCAKANYETPNAEEESSSDEKKVDPDKQPEPVPLEWETSYDMRPWTAFPERG